MNCSQILRSLPILAYGDCDSAEARAIEDHLDGCASCRTAFDEFVRVRKLLDSAPAPDIAAIVGRVPVDAPQPRPSRTRTRRWAMVLLAVTALVLLVAFVCNVEIRIDGSQLVVRWGNPPSVEHNSVRPESPTRLIIPEKAPAQDGADTAAAANIEERIRVLNALVHALAVDVDARDTQNQRDLTALQDRLDVVEEDSLKYHVESERSLTALYTAQFRKPHEGDKP